MNFYKLSKKRGGNFGINYDCFYCKKTFKKIYFVRAFNDSGEIVFEDSLFCSKKCFKKYQEKYLKNIKL